MTKKRFNRAAIGAVFLEEWNRFLDEVFVWESIDFSSPVKLLRSILFALIVRPWKTFSAFIRQRNPAKDLIQRVKDGQEGSSCDSQDTLSRVLFALDPRAVGVWALILILHLILLIISEKNDATNLYSNFAAISIVMITILFLVRLFLAKRDVFSLLITGTVSVLIAFGYLLQAMYLNTMNVVKIGAKDIDTSGSVIKSMATTSFSGIILALVFLCLMIGVIRSKRKRLYSALCTIMIIGCFVLLLSQKQINGAHIAISIGGRSFQLTEIIKLLSLLTVALVFSIDNMKRGVQLLYVLILMFVNGIGFLLCNEFGTLVIILFSTLALMAFQFKWTWTVGITIVLVVLSVIGYHAGEKAYYDLNPVVSIEEIDTSVFKGKYKTAEDLQILIEDERARQTDELRAKKLQEASFIKRTLNKIFKKIDERMPSTFYDKKTESGLEIEVGTTQITMMRQALKEAQPFGTTNAKVLNQIPEASRELIFVYAIMQLGYIPCALLVLCFAAFFVLTILASCRLSKLYFLLNLGIVMMISGQACVEILVSLNWFPLVGIGAAFLSNGGSALFVNYTLVFFVLWTMRNCTSAQEKKKLKSAGRRSFNE